MVISTAMPKENKKEINLKKGTGEYVGFLCVMIVLTVLFLFLAALLQFSASIHMLNQSLTATARAVSVCKNMKEAKEMARDVVENSVYSTSITNVKTRVEYATSKKTWANGVLVLVSLEGKINTLEPYWTSKVYKKTYLVTIEGGGGDINEAIQVCRKIIYAVETGGNSYGSQNYGSVESAYANSGSEHYITIGAGGWYGPEAIQVLKYIKNHYPDDFAKNDSAGISSLIAHNSQGLASVSGAQKNAIQKILTSPGGKDGSDAFMEEQIKAYFQEGQKNYGISDNGGLIEYMNIRHQGGQKAADRLSRKAEKPLTADSYYNAMQSDSGNQVGAYKGRQRTVYQCIKLYVH